MEANYFMTINKKGEIDSIAYAYPAHVLEDNQVELTEKEYNFLRPVKSLEDAEELIRSIRNKLDGMSNEASPVA